VASDLRIDLDGIDFAGLSRDDVVAALIDAAMIGGGAEFAKDDDDASGHWITIGGQGEGDDRHGGTPVFIKDGRITKGAPSLVGRRIDALKEDASDLGTHRQQLKASREHARAQWAKEARKIGHKPEHLHQLAAEMMAHDAATVEDRTKALQSARKVIESYGGDWRTIGFRAAKGGDATKTQGIDVAAETLSRQYPHLFTGGEYEHKTDRLFDLLAAGNPKAMHEDEAYKHALGELGRYPASPPREKGYRGKKARAATWEDIPFAYDPPSSRGRLVQPLTADFYSPEQPRDHRGRWTDGGPGGPAEERTHADRAARSAEGRRSLREHTQWQASDHARQFRNRTGPVTAAEAGALAAKLSKLSVKELHALKREHGLHASAPVKAELVRKLGERFAAHRAAQKTAVMPSAAQVTKPGADWRAELKDKPRWQAVEVLRTKQPHELTFDEYRNLKTYDNEDTGRLDKSFLGMYRSGDDRKKQYEEHLNRQWRAARDAARAGRREASKATPGPINVGDKVTWNSRVGPVEADYRGKQMGVDGWQATIIVHTPNAPSYQTTVSLTEIKAASAPAPSPARVTVPASLSPRLGRPGGGDKSHEQTPPRPLPASVPPRSAEHSMTAAQLRAAVVAHHAGKPLSPTTHSLLNHVATAEATLSRGAHPNGWKLTEAEKERLQRAMSESKAKLGALLRGGRAAFTEDDLAVFHLPGRLVAPFAKDDDEGEWRTINGAHVLIKDGVITKGPAHMVGKKADEAAGGSAVSDPVTATKALHDSMGRGSKPHGGSAALYAKVDAHIAELSKLPKAKLDEVWHKGMNRVQKLSSKAAILKAIREAIISRAGAYDRVTASADAAGPAATEDGLATFGRLAAEFAFDPDQPRDDDGKWSAGGSSRLRHAELRGKPVLTDEEQKEFDRLAEDMDRHETEQQIARNARTIERWRAQARDGVPHVKGAEAFRATVGGKTYWVHLRTVYHKRSYSFDGGDSWSGSMEQALENAKSAGGRTYPVSEGGPAPPATPAAASALPSVPAAKAAPPPTPSPAVAPKAAPKAARSGKKLLPANAISDFRPGVDRVERRGDKTFVVDGQGQYAPREVQSDRMTPEVEANMRKLTPTQREMAIRQTATTPYLSEEGRKERLRFLRGLDAGFSTVDRGRLVEAR
jgi:hypothetical protein